LESSDPVIDLLCSLQRARSEEELLSVCALQLEQLTGADLCQVFLAPEGENSHLGPGASSNSCFDLPAATIWNDPLNFSEAGRPLVVPQSLLQHRVAAYLADAVTEQMESAIFLPLVSEGRNIGAVFLSRRVPLYHRERDLHTVQRLVTASASYISGFRNAEDLGRGLNRISALTQVSQTISQSLYIEEILQLLVSITAQKFGFPLCTVRLLDERTEELVLRASYSEPSTFRIAERITLKNSLEGQALESMTTVVSEELPENHGEEVLLDAEGLHSMICLPLRIHDVALGVLCCYTDRVRAFQDDETQALETIANQAALSIENAKLQVRSTLMQEMHHRVKNNLQQVASLLRLQLQNASYRDLEQALDDSLSRILAIAAVHDLLSREELDHVNLKDIAERLVQHQQQAFVSPGLTIEFLVRGDPITLGMNKATQVALLLNELIQNAVIHGFKALQQGEVHVTVEHRDARVGIWVSNNGTPLAKDFCLEGSSGLGLQIVDSLTRSLGGEFRLRNVLGWTVAEVTFAAPEFD